MFSRFSLAWTQQQTLRHLDREEYALPSGETVSLPSPPGGGERGPDISQPPHDSPFRRVIHRGPHITIATVLAADPIDTCVRIQAGLRSGARAGPAGTGRDGLDNEALLRQVLPEAEFVRAPRSGEIPGSIAINHDVASEVRVCERPGVCLLSELDRKSAGGSYVTGAPGLEEDLCRRSDYIRWMRSPEMLREFPLEEHASVYLPWVTVFRAPEAADFAMYDGPSTISVAGVARPDSISTRRHPRTGEKTTSLPSNEKLRRAVYSLCLTALRRGIDILVVPPVFALYPLGVPPLSVARTILWVVAQFFEGCFRAVVFAAKPGTTVLDKRSRAQATIDMSDDALRVAGGKPGLVATDPFLAFHHVVLGPNEPVPDEPRGLFSGISARGGAKTNPIDPHQYGELPGDAFDVERGWVGSSVTSSLNAPASDEYTPPGTANEANLFGNGDGIDDADEAVL